MKKVYLFLFKLKSKIAKARFNNPICVVKQGPNEQKTFFCKWISEEEKQSPTINVGTYKKQKFINYI